MHGLIAALHIQWVQFGEFFGQNQEDTKRLGTASSVLRVHEFVVRWKIHRPQVGFAKSS
jgi:hypothetical protein